MKKILTSILLAIAIFSMAAIPTGNKTEKKNSKATITAKDQKDSAAEQPKKALSPAEKKAKRERALIEHKNEIWNSNNGGGRISYH